MKEVKDDYLRLEKALAQLRAGMDADHLLRSSGPKGPGAGGVAVLLGAVMVEAPTSFSGRMLSVPIRTDKPLPCYFPPGLTEIPWSIDFDHKSGRSVRAEGAFFVGVGKKPPAAVVDHLDAAVRVHLPESVAVDKMSGVKVRAALNRLKSTQTEQFAGDGIYAKDQEKLIETAMRSVSGWEAAGLTRYDLIQDAMEFSLEGLRLFAYGASRPKCTWSQWMAANVTRNLQRRVDSRSIDPSTHTARVRRFATTKPEIRDPEELRMAWLKDRAIDAGRADPAMRYMTNEQILALSDLSAWDKGAPPLSAFKVALSVRDRGLPLTLDYMTDDSDSPFSSWVIPAGDSNSERESEEEIIARSVLASIFAPVGASDVMTKELAVKDGRDVVSRKRQRELLEEVKSSAPLRARDLRSRLLMPGSNEPWPAAVVRRNWFGWYTSPIPRESAAYVSAGESLWSMDKAHFAAAHTEDAWRDWARRVHSCISDLDSNEPAHPGHLLAEFSLFARCGSGGPFLGYDRPKVSMPHFDFLRNLKAREQSELRFNTEWTINRWSKGSTGEKIGRSLVARVGYEKALWVASTLTMNKDFLPLARSITWGICSGHQPYEETKPPWGLDSEMKRSPKWSNAK